MEDNNVPVKTEAEVTPGSLRIVSREEWGCKKRPLKIDDMTGPANSVFLRYFTGYDNCWTEDECKIVVKNIQWKHKKTIRDIGFNFLIDRNGTVYEGMGWGKKCATPDFDIAKAKLGYTLDNMINLAYIGNFEEWEINQKMKDAVDNLVEYGVRNKFLIPKYQFMKIVHPK